MSTIKQMLQLHMNGESNRKIALQLGMNKETVNRYVNRAKADSMPLGELVKLDDPVLEHRMSGGKPAYSDHRFEQMKEKLPYFTKEKGRKHVTLRLLWEEYRTENPDGYSLTQFRYHCRQDSLASRNRPSTILKDMYVAGEKMFIDFAGDTMEYIDLETGEVVSVQMFVASLPATDYGYALGVPSQRSGDLVYAISCAFKAIGGVPKILVPDNLKSAVVKTDSYEPTLNRVLEDLANHYGCVVLPARPKRPKDKSLVEDQVKLVYQRVYAPLRNERFHSLEELNKAVAEKMKAHNQKRMHQLPFTREEQFLAIEKPALQPLPFEDFQIRSYASLTVGPNCCVLLGSDKHYYSAPHALIGQTVKVIYTRTLVKVYSNGACVATHQREYRPGRYTVIRDNLASNSLAYRDRSPDYYIAKGKQATRELGELITYMFATTSAPPEVFYRGCEGLLHLHRSTDPDLFRRACEAALCHQNYRYAFILQLVKTNCMSLEETRLLESEQDNEPIPDHANIRGKAQYQ